MGCLYLLTSPSGKEYLGISSKTAEERWAVHQMRVREGRSHALQQAIRKYGAENFSVKTLVVTNDWGYLCDLERAAIKRFNTKTPHGYNLTDGGEGVIGKVTTPETRAKMAASQKRRFATQDQSARMEKLLATTAAKRALVPDGYEPPWVVRKRAAAVRIGSPEHKALISKRTREGMRRPEVAEKVKRCAIERAANPEWRKKLWANRKRKVTA